MIEELLSIIKVSAKPVLIMAAFSLALGMAADLARRMVKLFPDSPSKTHSIPDTDYYFDDDERVIEVPFYPRCRDINDPLFSEVKK